MSANHQAKRAKRAVSLRHGRSIQAPRHGVPPAHDGGSGHSFSAASQEGSAKVMLASRLNELLREKGLSQSAAAQLLGMPQPKVSAIRNYKLRGISLERLMQALLALNQQVDIVVTSGRKASSGSIRVAV